MRREGLSCDRTQGSVLQLTSSDVLLVRSIFDCVGSTQSCSEPIAHRCWRAAARSLVFCHNLAPPFSFSLPLTIRVTSPRQHLPEGFFISQAQRPASTSAVIRFATVDFPVLRISSQMSWRVKPQQEHTLNGASFSLDPTPTTRFFRAD